MLLPPGAFDFDFSPAARYRQDVPTVESLIGHETGAGYVDHAEVTRTVEAIAVASDRVDLMRYGMTPEGRPLLLALVSSPANLARLDEIQANVAKLADPRQLGDDAARAALIEKTPVVVWLSFNVHGNEASGTEAGLNVLYHLAAAVDPKVDALLENAFVVIDPCLNPDGRDRFVRWFRSVSFGSPNPDPQAEEHREPWPGGRVNHYYFDLNRDWAFLTQAETRARLAQYRRFLPQVHVDFHEMGHESSYFFFPAAAPINDDFPRSVLEWGEEFGKGNAAAFDRNGWTYYTAEEFDLFYPGYGDSWPTLNGAIGMTYEQAGHSASGVVVERDDGTELTLKERAAHHFTAALATLDTAVAHRRELLASFAKFFEDSVWEGAHGPVREYVLAPRDSAGDSGRVHDLIALLLDQGIEVGVAEEGFEVARCHRYDQVAAELRRFPAGSFVIPLAQPRKHLAKVLLEPNAAVRENFFYDLSAWSLPLAFGVDCWWAEEAGTRRVTPLTEAPPTRKGAGGSPGVGYVVPWDSFRAPRFVAHCLAKRIAVRSAGAEFALAGREFPRGTLFLPAAGAGPDFAATIAAAADRFEVEAISAESSLTPRGVDLGSDSFRALALPRVAVITGEGTSASSVGALRWLFEQRYGLPYTAIPLRSLGSTDLRRYNVLVLPDGFGFGRELGAVSADLHAWVESGGVLIGIAGSAFALAQESLKLCGIRVGADKPPEKGDKPDAKDKKDAEPPGWEPAAIRAVRAAEQALPGTLFRVRLDPDHPLAYGYGDTVAVLMDSTQAFAADGPGGRLGVFGPDSRLSGFASSDTQAKLDGKAYLAEQSVGAGRVVLFAGDPTFRGFVRGQNGLLLNAIFLYAKAPPPAR